MPKKTTKRLSINKRIKNNCNEIVIDISVKGPRGCGKTQFLIGQARILELAGYKNTFIAEHHLISIKKL